MAPISKSEAVNAAQRSMRKNENFRWRLFGHVTVDYDVNLDQVWEVIALPEVYPTMGETDKSAISKLPPTEPRYCWVVPFKSTEKEDRIEVSGVTFVYVDMETAQVIRLRAH